MSKNEESKLFHGMAILSASLLFCSFLSLDISAAAAELESTAVVPAEPLDPPWPNIAIVALNDSPCPYNNGAAFGGSGDTYIHGGIFTNGCLTGNGNNFDVIVDDGYIRYVGGFHGYNNFDPDPEQVNIPITEIVDLEEVIQAECAKLPFYPPASYKQTTEQTILYPGNYLGPSFIDGNTELIPGLYCVTEDITIDAGESVVGSDVTIFLQGGNVTINGGALLNLSAPKREVGPLNIFRHLLFYVTQGDITWGCGSGQYAEGRVYAPMGDIQVSGNFGYGAVTLNTQFVGWNVEVTGNSIIDIMPYFLEDFVDSD